MSINELYDSLGLPKWWNDPLPSDSILYKLPLVD